MIVLNLNRVTAKIRGKTLQGLVKNLNIGCFFMTLYYLQLLHSMNYELLGQACFIFISALK